MKKKNFVLFLFVVIPLVINIQNFAQNITTK